MKQKILAQNGIITEVDAKPRPTVADCARCQLIDPLENKYCSSCGYPLSVAAYEELKATDNEELNKVKLRLQEFEGTAQEIPKLKDHINQLSADLYKLIFAVEQEDELRLRKAGEQLVRSNLIRRTVNPDIDLEVLKNLNQQMRSGTLHLPEEKVTKAMADIKARQQLKSSTAESRND